MNTKAPAVRDRAQMKIAAAQLLGQQKSTPEREALASLIYDSLDRDVETIEWLKSPLGQQQAHAQALLKLRQIEAEQRAAVVDYLLTGEQKSWTAQDDPSGAILLPTGLHGEIVNAAASAWAMRKLCRNVTISTPTLDVGVRTSALDDAEWTTLLDTGDEDTSKPYGLVKAEPQFLVKRLKVSRSLLRKGGRLAEQEILSIVLDAVGKPIEQAVINGNGPLKPVGLLNEPGLPSYTTASSGVLTIADAKRWVGRLPARYHSGATALMHGDTYSALLELDTAGALFQNGQLLGRYPIELSDEFPSAGTNPASLTGGTPIAVLGDFSYQWIIDSLFEIQRLSELYAETNEVGFIARCEVDSVCTRPRAFNVLTVKP